MSYRPEFHLSPPSGRLNDPNGLLLADDGTLHVFYQHDPAFPHGQKRTGWGHASMRMGEGIWYHHPDALYPDFPYDADGCYSGSALVHEGTIRLLYTGNLKVNGQRYASQNVVDVHEIDGPEGGFYRRRADNPLIEGQADGFTAHYRDPQVSRDGKRWRMVLGAQRTGLTGAVVLYESSDTERWSFAGPLEFSGLDPKIETAYMWECPNLLTLIDQVTGQSKDVLVFCPQFPELDTCGYVVGTLTGLHFAVEQDFRKLDEGHEFYAPQLIPYRDGALMMGWMGLPGRDDTPTVEAEGWVHQLTLPRYLTLRDGALCQKFVLPGLPTTTQSKTKMTMHQQTLGHQPVELSLIDETGATIVLVEWDGRRQLSVAKGGDVRRADCPPGEVVLVADGAAVEVIGGDGAVAFSLAAFSTGGAEWSEWK